jgi:hypothetical protein
MADRPAHCDEVETMEIKVTPEMIEAGAEIIWDHFDLFPSSYASFVSEKVFLAMARLAKGNRESHKQKSPTRESSLSNRGPSPLCLGP